MVKAARGAMANRRVFFCALDESCAVVSNRGTPTNPR